MKKKKTNKPINSHNDHKTHFIVQNHHEKETKTEIQKIQQHTFYDIHSTFRM